jgi:hypothetical protein
MEFPWIGLPPWIPSVVIDRCPAYPHIHPKAISIPHPFSKAEKMSIMPSQLCERQGRVIPRCTTRDVKLSSHEHWISFQLRRYTFIALFRWVAFMIYDLGTVRCFSKVP